MASAPNVRYAVCSDAAAVDRLIDQLNNARNREWLVILVDLTKTVNNTKGEPVEIIATTGTVPIVLQVTDPETGTTALRNEMFSVRVQRVRNSDE